MVYLPENKQTSGLRTQQMRLPETVVILLRQNIGAACNPTVKVGDSVLAGQKIGDTDSYCSGRVHSSVSGEVVEISSKLAPFGCEVQAVTIKSDGRDQWEEKKGILEPMNASREELLEAIREAGIVGMGGAMFPTHVKLNPPKEKKIDALIVNGAECEPYITSDHRTMIEHPEEIMGGVRMLRKILGVGRVFIGIEKNKWDAIDLLKSRAGKEDIRIMPLDASYPQGAEKTLINTLLHREVPSGCLPMDVNAVVQNVSTVKAVYDAIVHGKPLVERAVTVAGAVKEPRNLKVRIGTPFQDLIDYCGQEDGITKIIAGGPMMGVAQPHAQVPVVKGTTGILLLRESDINVEERTCIRCSECIRACPAYLMPNMLALYSQHARYDDAMSYGLTDCVECGNCAYVCPSKIKHVHWIRLAKAKASKKGGKK